MFSWWWTESEKLDEVLRDPEDRFVGGGDGVGGDGFGNLRGGRIAGEERLAAAAVEVDRLEHDDLVVAAAIIGPAPERRVIRDLQWIDEHHAVGVLVEHAGDVLRPAGRRAVVLGRPPFGVRGGPTPKAGSDLVGRRSPAA